MPLRGHVRRVRGHAGVVPARLATEARAAAADAAVHRAPPARRVCVPRARTRGVRARGRGRGRGLRRRRVVRERRLLVLRARERVEERLDEVLRRAQAERRRETVRLDVPRAVRVRERALRLGLVRADVEVELAREARVEEAVVGQDARDGREDLALAQWRGLDQKVRIWLTPSQQAP